MLPTTEFHNVGVVHKQTHSFILSDYAEMRRVLARYKEQHLPLRRSTVSLCVAEGYTNPDVISVLRHSQSKNVCLRETPSGTNTAYF